MLMLCELPCVWRESSKLEGMKHFCFCPTYVQYRLVQWLKSYTIFLWLHFMVMLRCYSKLTKMEWSPVSRIRNVKPLKRLHYERCKVATRKITQFLWIGCGSYKYKIVFRIFPVYALPWWKLHMPCSYFHRSYYINVFVKWY